MDEFLFPFVPSLLRYLTCLGDEGGQRRTLSFATTIMQVRREEEEQCTLRIVRRLGSARRWKANGAETLIGDSVSPTHARGGNIIFSTLVKR